MARLNFGRQGELRRELRSGAPRFSLCEKVREQLLDHVDGIEVSGPDRVPFQEPELRVVVRPTVIAVAEAPADLVNVARSLREEPFHPGFG